MTNKLLENALSYAKRGWYIFPCREKPGQSYIKDGETIKLPEKSPYTSNGFYSATRDYDQINSWWKTWPEALIGIYAGKSDLFVIDIDKKHINGLEIFEKWDINDSAGLHSITPSGGFHIIFSGHGKTSTNAKTGIDTRGDKGYFIVPPSKIIEGGYIGEYKKLDDWGKKPGIIPDGLMGKLFPEKTVQYVRGNSSLNLPHGAKKKLPRRALEFLANGAPEGERNSTLFKVAADMAGANYDIEHTIIVTSAICELIGLSKGESLRTIESAYSKPRNSSIPDSIQEKLLFGDKKKLVSEITHEEQSIMEDAIMACMIENNKLIPVIADIVIFEDFSVIKNRLLFQIIKSMYNIGRKVDYLTLSDEVSKQTDKINVLDIQEIINKYSIDVENAITYAEIIKEKSAMRKLEAIMDNKNFYFSAGNLIEIIARVEEDITEVALHSGIKSTNVLTSKQAVNILTERTKKILSGEIEQLKIGFDIYDKHVGGLFPTEFVICAARSGEGKCLGKGTKIIMYDGSIKKVEDIVAGDLLMGADSSPRKVLSTTNGIDDMYKIKQNRAIDYIVNSKHILSLKQSRNDKNSKNGTLVNISVKDYIKLSKKSKNNLKGYKVPIEFTKKDLPIEPYYLGIWLGDGTSSKPQITSADKEVVEYIYNYAKKLNMKVSTYQNTENCWQYAYVGGMLGRLRDIKVLNNKYIPFNYLTSSEEDRLELLAGIIDSDGYMGHNGFEITQKNINLMKDIKFLADSLGFRTSPIREKIATIKSIDFSGIYYRITIHGKMWAVPTKIKRKQVKFTKKKINQSLTGIKVEYIGKDEYYGFMLDGNGLFLLEDGTVTHNSALALSIANHVAIVQKKPVAFFSLEMSTPETMCRLICQLTGLPFKNVYLGKLTPEQWARYGKAVETIKKAPLFFDDSFGITVPEIRSKIRKLKEKEDIKLVFIDQLEQIRSYEGLKTHLQYDKITYDIKDLTKEFEIPIILNHQLNRNISNRRYKDPEPLLSDLNQAGEKPVTQVWAIRHQKDDAGEILNSRIIMLKNRNGPTLTFPVQFIGERMLFSNATTDEENRYSEQQKYTQKTLQNNNNNDNGIYDMEE